MPNFLRQIKQHLSINCVLNKKPPLAMLKNYLLTSLRNFTRFKLYSLINILGLTIGFAAFIMIFIFVKHELSFDQFHENKDVIVKANLEFGTGPDDAEPVSVTPTALLPVFTEKFPEVTGGTRYFNPSSFRPSVVLKDNNAIQEKGFAYADSTFFEVFSYNLVAGDEKTALVDPKSLILTESASQKYFRDKDPMGEELVINGESYLIKGIMEDVPENSHLKFNMLASFSSHPASKRTVWWSANYFTYLTLTSNGAINSIEPKIQDLLVEQEYSQPEQGFYANVKLVPLSDIYLKSEADQLSDIKYIYIFSAIALIILVIGSINYMNLATARSVTRAKEVGIRKVTGASRISLMFQFITEAIMISFISLIGAYIVVYISLGLFNNYTGKSIDVSFLFSSEIMLPVALTALVVGLLSGSYPAFLLSSFQPVSILKGSFAKSGKGVLLRKVLVVFQFAVSIMMIIATLIIGQQLKFIQNKKLGYNKDAVIAIPINRDIFNRSESIKNELKATGYAASISMAAETPVFIRGGYSMRTNEMPEGFTHGTTAIPIDESFVETFGMNLISGSTLEKIDVDRTKPEEDREYAFVVNQKAIELLEMDANQAIGKIMSLDGRKGVIKGVVEDFHFRSFHQEIGPLVMFPEARWGYNYMMIKISGEPQIALETLGAKWKEMIPERPFSYEFISDRYNQLYQSEKAMGQIFQSFSAVAILVACLGLFGLASFISFQRSKEISIRKVLGASSKGLVYLISKDFILLVIIAFIIAAPLGYFFMDNWLMDFKYRAAIAPWHIISALLITLIIAFSTVSYHALKSASTNPADVLKNE